MIPTRNNIFIKTYFLIHKNEDRQIKYSCGLISQFGCIGYNYITVMKKVILFTKVINPDFNIYSHLKSIPQSSGELKWNFKSALVKKRQIRTSQRRCLSFRRACNPQRPENAPVGPLIYLILICQRIQRIGIILLGELSTIEWGTCLVIVLKNSHGVSPSGGREKGGWEAGERGSFEDWVTGCLVDCFTDRCHPQLN